jgi:hypothetical protein
MRIIAIALLLVSAALAQDIFDQATKFCEGVVNSASDQSGLKGTGLAASVRHMAVASCRSGYIEGLLLGKAGPKGERATKDVSVPSITVPSITSADVPNITPKVADCTTYLTNPPTTECAPTGTGSLITGSGIVDLKEVGSLQDGICSICKKKGLKSTVTMDGMMSSTAVFCGNGHYDEDGVFVYPKPCNTVTQYGRCSRGHTVMVQSNH